MRGQLRRILEISDAKTSSTSTATWHRPHFFCKDSWSHIYQSPLDVSARSHRHQLVRSVCSEVTASTRNVWRSTSASIQNCDYFQNLPRLKCLMGFYISHRQTTPEGFPPSHRAQLSVLQNFLIWLNLLKQHMINCSSSPLTTTIFCLVFNNRNLTIVTTCARNITAENYYRKTLICSTEILLFGYFTKTVIN